MLWASQILLLAPKSRQVWLWGPASSTDYAGQVSYFFPRKWSRSGNDPCCLPPCLLLGNSINTLAAAQPGQIVFLGRTEKLSQSSHTHPGVPHRCHPAVSQFLCKVHLQKKCFHHESSMPTSHSPSYHSTKHWAQNEQEEASGNAVRSVPALGFTSLPGQRALGLPVFLAVGGAACRSREPSVNESWFSLEKGLPRGDEAASCLGRQFRGLEPKESQLAAIIWSRGMIAASDWKGGALAKKCHWWCHVSVLQVMALPNLWKKITWSWNVRTPNQFSAGLALGTWPDSRHRWGVHSAFSTFPYGWLRGEGSKCMCSWFLTWKMAMCNPSQHSGITGRSPSLQCRYYMGSCQVSALASSICFCRWAWLLALYPLVCFSLYLPVISLQFLVLLHLCQLETWWMLQKSLTQVSG